MKKEKLKQIVESLFTTLDDMPKEDAEACLQSLLKELDGIIIMCQEKLHATAEDAETSSA